MTASLSCIECNGNASFELDVANNIVIDKLTGSPDSADSLRGVGAATFHDSAHNSSRNIAA
jgi:hypothetical protein